MTDELTHAVCLSFDFDSVSLWMALGQKTPTAISRGEFGAIGAQRILNTLSEHDIPGTWFIPGITIETFPEVVRKIAAQGHEIGHHGFRHVSPVKMTLEEELSIQSEDDGGTARVRFVARLGLSPDYE